MHLDNKYFTLDLPNSSGYCVFMTKNTIKFFSKPKYRIGKFVYWNGIPF